MYACVLCDAPYMHTFSIVHFSVVVITLLCVLCNNHFYSLWTITLPHIGNEEVFQINAMAVSFGKLEEFNTTNGDEWVQYIECMEHYFLVNKITDTSKQRLILINSMGQQAYKFLRNTVVVTSALKLAIDHTDDDITFDNHGPDRLGNFVPSGGSLSSGVPLLHG